MRFHKVLALVLLMAASVPAYGGPNEGAARAEYEQANAAYYQGRFDEAAARYQAVYGLVRDPNMLFNIAQSYSLAGRDEQALSFFRGFLREAPADSPNRPQAERFIEELNRKIEAKQAAAANPVRPIEGNPAVPGFGAVPVPVPGAAPAPSPAYAPAPAPGVAPAPAPAAPVGQPAYVPAPTAQPVFTSVPQPWAAPAASPPQADLITQTNPPAPNGTAEERPFYNTWWFWTAAGAAVVAGTVTAFLLTRKSSDACDGVGMDCVRVK
jgi:tetratricopeptide (TPR) repeat protein